MEAGSKSRLKALLRKKAVLRRSQSQSHTRDPIEMALLNNPGLTREKIEEMAEKLSF